MKCSLKDSFNHVDFRIVMTNTFIIGSFFKIKYPIPDNVRWGVVCSYQCCSARYVGYTCTSFRARRLEHLGLSIHTGNPILRPKFSNIRNHSNKYNHPMEHENFKITHSIQSSDSLLIAESVLIKHLSPSLNSHLKSKELNHFRTQDIE